MILKMVVDEQRLYVLCRFYRYKTQTTTVESNHKPLILEFNVKWSPKINEERKEVYNHVYKVPQRAPIVGHNVKCTLSMLYDQCVVLSVYLVDQSLSN